MRNALFVTLVVGGSLTAQAQAPDIANGRASSAQCIACHGLEGVAPNPTFPHLAGQNAAYLQMQLENFRNGERYHPLMTPVAQSLAAQEVRDLAAYFSSIGPLAASR